MPYKHCLFLFVRIYQEEDQPLTGSGAARFSGLDPLPLHLCIRSRFLDDVYCTAYAPPFWLSRASPIHFVGVLKGKDTTLAKSVSVNQNVYTLDASSSTTFEIGIIFG